MNVDADSTPVAAADPIAASPVYPAGSRVNERGHLEVAGCDVVQLAERFGTPAYIYAEDDIRHRAEEYIRAFAERTDSYEVIYASKALPCTAAYRLMRDAGLSVDVASGGELHMALAAGFDPARIHMHGNNKTERELRYAADAGVGHLILDSFDEIELADRLLDRPQEVLIRVTPGIKPSTHDYVQTGQLDSKFGFGLADRLAEDAVERVRESANLELVGLHAHIGSQIFELEPYVKAIEVIADFCESVDLAPDLLNVGGGLGIAYLDSDEPPSIADYVDVKVRGVQRVFDPAPRILVEPGRSLVGNAGVTAYRVGTVKEIPGVRTYVAVDGGMSDNLRPMLYGSRYEALIADRAAETPETLATVAGMHCESGDVLVRDTELADPRVGDVLVTPATGAYGHAMANNYNGVPRPPVIFCREGEARVVVRRETWDDLLQQGRVMADNVNVGILGKGTVGAAFRRLLNERAEMVEEVSGRRPRVSGVLSRRKGDFDRILSRSEIVVELIGGIDPALGYVTRALREGKHVVTANKQLLAQHGEELVEAAREGGAQLRFEAAVAGAIPAIRVVQESLGAIPIEKVFGIVNGTTNYILTEMARSGLSYEEALKQAQDLGYAESDPTDDVGGADAAAKMAILARLAFGAPVELKDVPYEGIERIKPDDIAYAKELGLSLKLLGVAERIGEGEISVRVFPCFLYPGHPLSPIEGPFNAVMVESPAITEITMSGPGAGGPETAAAVLGDVVSVINGGSPLFEENARLRIARDAKMAFYLHLEVDDEPGVLARVAEVLGDNGVSVRSVVQRGLGGEAQLIMVMHPVSEKRFATALRRIAKLPFLRSAPRSIRVIEEEFG